MTLSQAWDVKKNLVTLKVSSTFSPWAPSLPLDQVLGLALAEPLLGDGLGGEHLVPQLVLLAALHPGGASGGGAVGRGQEAGVCVVCRTLMSRALCVVSRGLWFMCHGSWVMCHVSCVLFHVSCAIRYGSRFW